MRQAKNKLYGPVGKAYLHIYAKWKNCPKCGATSEHFEIRDYSIGGTGEVYCTECFGFVKHLDLQELAA